MRMLASLLLSWLSAVPPFSSLLLLLVSPPEASRAADADSERSRLLRCVAQRSSAVMSTVLAMPDQPARLQQQTAAPCTSRGSSSYSLREGLALLLLAARAHSPRASSRSSQASAPRPTSSEGSHPYLRVSLSHQGSSSRAHLVLVCIKRFESRLTDFVDDQG